MNSTTSWRVFLRYMLVSTLAVVGSTGRPGTIWAQGSNCATAPSVAINPGTLPSFTLTANAQHYFKILVPSFSIPNSRVQLTTSTEGETNTYGYLRYADGLLIAEDSLSGLGDNFLISRTALAPGTYCLQVRGQSTSTTGQYWLRVEGDLANDTPGGSDFSSSAIVRSNNLILARLLAYNDWDYFQFQVPAGGGVVTAEAQGSTNTYGYLFDADGRPIAEDSLSGPGDNFRISVTLAPGIYYVRVRGQSPSITGDYWLSVTGAVVPPTAFCAGVITTMVGGTDGPDILKGTVGNDVIQAFGGNDTVYGFGGNDIICGGAGDDVLVGGDGNDRLYGEAGNNILRGENGTDYLYGNTGVDILDGGTGIDRLYGYAGNDVLVGGSENDFLYGYEGNDVLVGGLGLDVRDGGANKDVCDQTVGEAAPVCEVVFTIPWRERAARRGTVRNISLS
jgi:RTX calcium-binding nonapeptide repeat (4 copies)/Bacterial pre-peptidase C-terminal domain